MTDTVFQTQNPKTSDPQVTALVNKVADAFKLEVLNAALRQAGAKGLTPMNFSGNKTAEKVHAAVGAYLNRISPNHRQALIQRAVNRNLPNTILGRGTLASTISLRSGIPVLAQLDTHREYAFMSDENKIQRLASAKFVLPKGIDLSKILGKKSGAVTAAPPPVIMNGGLHFRIHEVKCSDPTDWEWGKDEINMGAVTTDDKGTVEKINEFVVRDDFDKNVAQTYSPPKILKNFSLSGGDYPKTFMVDVALVEKDSGGFAEFLTALYEAIKDHINTITATLGAAAGAAIGTAIGGTVGSIGGPLGTAIGVIAGMVIGALVGWLTSALKDDFFTPQMAVATIPSPGSLFNGSGVSRLDSLNYYDNGGEYHVTYSWEVVWS